MNQNNGNMNMGPNNAGGGNGPNVGNIGNAGVENFGGNNQQRKNFDGQNRNFQQGVGGGGNNMGGGNQVCFNFYCTKKQILSLRNHFDQKKKKKCRKYLCLQ